MFADSFPRPGDAAVRALFIMTMTAEEKAQFCIDHPYKTPAFQFYPESWWGSRHVTAMSLEQRGFHAGLIFSAWQEENCGIPENEICISSRTTDDKKPIGLQVLSWCWFLYKGFWFSEKLLNERIKQINIGIERQLAGSKGGRPKESRRYNKKAIDNQMISKDKAKKSKSIDININTDTDINTNTKKEKEDSFKKEIFVYNTYPLDMLEGFFKYWSEWNRPQTKMRFELQDTWELSKRLATWANRQPLKKPQYGRQEVSNEEILAQMKRVKLS